MFNTNDKVITTTRVDRVCGTVEKDTEGFVEGTRDSCCWVKFPGHARSIKVYEDEIRLKDNKKDGAE